MESYDVAVVGLGALGSGAAYYAAKRGAKVIAFEQYELGHARGASHDTSRIFRTSNPHPKQVALAMSALRDWRDLEQQVGQELLTTTGGVVLFPKDGPESREAFTDSLDANGLPYELLSAEQISSRWPKFQFSQEVEAVYTRDTGIVNAAKTVMVFQYLARTHGAVLKDRTTVERIVPGENGVTVETSKGRVRARKVVLAADAWTNKLLSPLGAEIPLAIMQEQVTYFKPDSSVAAGFEPDNFPVWIWAGSTFFYGFPSYGEPTLKMARDFSGNYMSPEERTYVPSKKLIRELSNFADSIMPEKGEELRTITCQYAIPPGRQIIIGHAKGQKDIVVALGAGLGFKFAPAIGRVLAELALDGKSVDDISVFAVPTGEAQSKL